MPTTPLLRPTFALAALSLTMLALAGCVAPPALLQPGQTYASQQCFAGFYTCVVPPGTPGTPCACPGIGAPSYGVIR